jgi:acyl dehydratase
LSLDLSAVGYKTPVHTFTYDWKTVALYALGVGARRDELDYLLETRGPRVLPTFAVVPPMAAVDEVLQHTGGDFAKVVHYSQVIRVHADIPAQGTLESVGVLEAIYDLKRFSQAVVVTQTQQDGTLLFETEFTVLYRDTGNFGGSAPPKRELPKVPKDTSPTFVEEQVTSPEQALLYRLSGDLNPLHAEPEVARIAGFPEGPILHGLATYGFAGRALVLGLAGRSGGAAPQLKEFGAQFKRPVWPGDVLRTEAFELTDGTFALQTFAGGRSEAVLTGWARFR